MSTRLDGIKVADICLTQAQLKAMEYEQKYKCKPKLAIVSIGDNAASEVYLRNKQLAGNRANVAVEVYEYDSSYSQAELEMEVKHLNSDKSIDGIIIQLPIPTFYDADRIISLISPDKDVDGLTATNQGYTAMGINQGFRPCTPLGIVTLLRHYHLSVSGKKAVIIGRSKLVGKPLASMLTAMNATVTLCHTYTQNLDNYTRSADIIIVAVGKPDFLTSDMIKPGTIVIDVGINRVNKKIKGDCADDLDAKASWLTPVPGGIGPMTVAMLMTNTVEAAYYGHCSNKP